MAMSGAAKWSGRGQAVRALRDATWRHLGPFGPEGVGVPWEQAH
eukprot:g20127.t1